MRKVKIILKASLTTNLHQINPTESLVLHQKTPFPSIWPNLKTTSSIISTWIATGSLTPQLIRKYSFYAKNKKRKPVPRSRCKKFLVIKRGLSRKWLRRIMVNNWRGNWSISQTWPQEPPRPPSPAKTCLCLLRHPKKPKAQSLTLGFIQKISH